MSEKGRINPHNPDFLTKKPWYLAQGGGGSEEPTLEHQQRQTEKELLTLSQADALLEQKRKKEKELKKQGKFTKDQWVESLYRGKLPYKMAKVVALHGKGALLDLEYEDGQSEKRVNPHKKVNGKPLVKHIASGSRAIDAAGETYDSKRDAYHGYDADTHNKKLVEKFEEREAIRRKIREEEEAKNEGKKKGADDDSSGYSDVDSDSDDEFAEKDGKVITTRIARQGGVGGAQMKITARNLRIREDTAKYLRNLDPESALYDPKSRSMRDNPNPHLAPEETTFAGDNFVRMTGDALEFEEAQTFADNFAWDATGKTSAINAQTNPSQAEMLKKQYQNKALELKLKQKKAVLDKYGGAEYLDGSGGLASAADSKREDAVDRNIRFGVQTKAKEYSRDGQGTSNKAPKKRERLDSKYKEDVFINGHTTVWGSYFHKGAITWGYADDHSLIKNSYCTGENGRIANDEANEMRYGSGKAGSAALAQARGMLKAIPGPMPGDDAQIENSKEAQLLLDQQKVREALARAQSEKKRKLQAMEQFD